MIFASDAPAPSDPPSTVTPAALAEALVQPLNGQPEAEGVRLFLLQDLEQRIAVAGSQRRRSRLTRERAWEKLKGAPRPCPPRRWRGLGLLICSLLVVLAAASLQLPKLPALAWYRQIRLPGETVPGEKFQAAMRLPHPPPGAWQISGPAPDRFERVPGAPDPEAARTDPAAYLETLMAQPSRALDDDGASWRKLDPDNAMWLTLDAYRRISYGAVDYDRQRARAVELFHEAQRLPAYRTYLPERRRAMLAAYRPPRNWAEAEGLRALTQLPAAFLPMDQVTIIELSACKKNGDAQGAHEAVQRYMGSWLIQWRDVTENNLRISNFSNSSPDISGSMAYYGASSSDVARVRELTRELDEMPGPMFRGHSGEEERLRPAVQAVYPGMSALEWASTVFSAQTALLVLALLAWLGALLLWARQAGWRKKDSAAWLCAACLEPLLRPRSRAASTALMLAAGFLLPALWIAGWLATATYAFHGYLLWSIVGYAACLTVTALALAATPRVNRILGFVGFSPSRAGIWTGLGALLLTAAALPVAIARMHNLTFDLTAMQVPQAMAIAGPLWVIGHSFAGLYARSLTVRHILIARRMLPACAIMAILLSLPVAALDRLERRHALLAMEEIGQPRRNEKAAAIIARLTQEWEAANGPEKP